MKTPRSLSRYILVIALICVLPLTLFAALLMHRINDLQFRSDSASLANASRNNAFRLDHEVAEARASLETLAYSNSLSVHDYERFRYAATMVAQRFGGEVSVVDPAGMTLVSTGASATDVVPTSPEIIAAARNVTSTGEAVVATLFPNSAMPDATLMMPAPAKDNAGAVIVFSLPLKSFAAPLTAVPARLATTVTLLDRDGAVLWRSDNASGIGGRDDNSILERLRDPPGGMWRATAADHSPIYAAAAPAKDTPWTVVIETSAHAVDGPLDRALHQLSAALLGALLFAFVGAMLLGRQLKRAIEDLIAAAKVLGEARRNPRAPMPVRELSELEAVLANASALLTQERARRNAAESAQEQSETLLTDLQHAASMASWEWDIATGSIVWSDAMYRLFLLAPEAMPPSRARLISLIHSRDRAAAAAWLATLARDEAHRPIEFHIMRADGETRSVRCDAKAVRDENGVLIKILGTMQDITELKRLEAQLAESRGDEPVAEEEAVDVAGLVGAATYLAEPQAAQAGVILAAQVAPDAGAVKCSERDLKEILLRLLTRAIASSSQGAEISLHAGLDPEGGLVIEVSDCGAALAQSEIGEGGAFATVKSLIEKQGGSLRLSGTTGSGLVARLHLPAERVLRKVA
jgi:PAS domain S-box-containing protein